MKPVRFGRIACFVSCPEGWSQAQRLEAELAERQLTAPAGGGKDRDRFAVKRPTRTADRKSRRLSVIAIDAGMLENQS
jgi:hypothetical protein